MDAFAPTADEYVPFAQLTGLDMLVELQYVPAGHAVDDFKPSEPQNSPAGQPKQRLTLIAPVVGWNVPAAHSVGAVVAGLGQYAPSVQFRQSPSAAALVAGMNVPTGHA